MKDELGGHIMKKFVRLRAETCNYLEDNNDADKNAKGTKRSVVKKPLNFKVIKNA